MALNLNPDDYGIEGSLDKKGMEDRLEEIRKQIASFGPTAVADVKRSADPVYGQGVATPEYVTGDRKDYRAVDKGGELPAFLADYIADSKKFTDAYAEKLAFVPEARPEPTPEPTPETPEKKAKRNLLLPDLAETTKGDKIKAPKRFLKGRGGGDKGDFSKNPSFDGRSFEDFLAEAKGTRQVSVTDKGRFDTDMPANPELNKLYNKLKDKGMSDKDMFKSAQFAGLTNVRTGKEGKSDFKQMVKAYKDGFKNEESEPKRVGKRTIYNWYLDEGGKTNKSMNKLLRQSGVKDYDSVKDARKFTKFLTKKLNDSDARLINVGMDKATDAFGGKFNRADYKAALDYKGQDQAYITDYLKDYLDRGGQVGQNVLNLLNL